MKHEPDSFRSSLARRIRSLRYDRYEWTPSCQVSRNARIISGSCVRSSSLPSFTSRLLTKGWKFDPYLIPYGGSRYTICTCPDMPSFSKREFMTSRESPAIRRLDHPWG